MVPVNAAPTIAFSTRLPMLATSRDAPITAIERGVISGCIEATVAVACRRSHAATDSDVGLRADFESGFVEHLEHHRVLGKDEGLEATEAAGRGEGRQPLEEDGAEALP